MTNHRTYCFLIICLLCCFTAISSHSDPTYVVDKIVFKSCEKTDSSWLESLLSTREGEVFDVETYELDLQRLRNLNLFFSVTGEWFVREQKFVDIIIEITESIYIYPLVAVSGFDDIFKLNLGISTINWKGSGGRLGIAYQFYDRHSLSLYQSTPRHFKGKTGHTISISRYATIEPLYFTEEIADFNYDVYNLMLGGHYWINYHSKLGIGSAYFYEIYKNREDNIPEYPSNRSLTFNKLQLYSIFDSDHRNFNFEMVDGYQGRLYGEYIADLDNPNYTFYKLEAEFKYYSIINEYNQWAIRTKVGIATNRFTPFLPYVIDGYINVRGVGNRIHRGTAVFVNNFEYRQRFWRNKWFIAQAVAFIDVSFIRNAEQKLFDIFNDEQNYSYGGIGGRIILQRWYTTTFRLDYGHDLLSIKGWGNISFGVDQFF